MSTAPAAPASSADFEPGDERKIVATLSAEPAALTRRLARHMGVNVPEVLRRALVVLDLIVSLDADEELVIRNRKTKEIERIRFLWPNA